MQKLARRCCRAPRTGFEGQADEGVPGGVFLGVTYSLDYLDHFLGVTYSLDYLDHFFHGKSVTSFEFPNDHSSHRLENIYDFA